MKEEDFLFSLYPSDLVRATHRKGIKLTLINKDSTWKKNLSIKSEMLYFCGANIHTGAMTMETHDRTYDTTIGIKTLEKLEKYQVDVLGNISPVGKEKRQRFN